MWELEWLTAKQTIWVDSLFMSEFLQPFFVEFIKLDGNYEKTRMTANLLFNHLRGHCSQCHFKVH